jgi:hypothetical protein
MTSGTDRPESLRYVATMATPSYLPWSDDLPPSFLVASDAWAYLADERRRQEDRATEIDESGPDELSYSDTVSELDKLASATGADVAGTVYGDTPGYDGSHDLGIVYSVDALPHTRACLARAIICAVENLRDQEHDMSDEQFASADFLGIAYGYFRDDLITCRCDDES